MLFAQEENHFLCFAWVQSNHRRKGTTRVHVVVHCSRQFSLLNSIRVAVIGIVAEEGFLVTAGRINLGLSHSKETLGHMLSVLFLIRIQSVHVAVNLLDDPVLVKCSACDEKRILKVNLVLLVVAVVGKFSVTRYSKVPWLTVIVGDFKRPNLIAFSKGNVVACLALD